MVNYEHLARDLLLWMKQDQHEDSWFTTMVDFYRLPNNFPGYDVARQIQLAHDRVAYLEAELSRDIERRLGDTLASRRFIPYIQLHEFEALLFAEPEKFIEVFPNKQAAIAELVAIRAQFPDPEYIDEGPLTAPSKRILNFLPDYQKPVAGLLIAQSIGLEKIRRECPRFDNLFNRLIALAE